MSVDPGYTVTAYAINASGGALITILGTRLSRRAEIIEDGGSNAGVGQGLIYYLPLISPDGDGAVTWEGPFQIEPETEPLRLGNVPSDDRQFGHLLCNGPGHVMQVGVTPALPLIQIKSAGSATVVRITEFA